MWLEIAALVSLHSRRASGFGAALPHAQSFAEVRQQGAQTPADIALFN